MPLDWSNIDSVFLDLDGTLLDLHFDNHFWLEHVPIRYAEKHQLGQDEARQILNGKYSAVANSLNWYCIDYWSRELELDITQLKHEIADKISVRPSVENFLQYLHMHGKRVVLVTNAHSASLAIKMNKTGLDRHFDHIITSHELRHAKEHANFWPALQSVEPFDVKRTLFIDDNFQVLDAARNYGIKNLLAIRKPDSRGADKQHHSYILLDTFEQIMT
ncbi:MAG: GMP/IMP nucleotidase [Gammaproteobacteria bacterium]|nr:GMP/IMP nucleotidase [Gammaproteobacteria bacterium]